MASAHQSQLRPESQLTHHRGVIAIVLAALGLALGALVIQLTASGELPLEALLWRLGAVILLLGFAAGYAVRRLRRLLAELADARHAQAEIRQTLQTRTQSMDRLLGFAQTIQAAGRPEQIYTALDHALRAELDLSHLAILTHDPDQAPPTRLVNTAEAADIPDLDPAACPCLRQALPRLFTPDGPPIRCGIERILNLPESHPGYCIPFSIGPGRILVHMLLPPGRAWNEDIRQLAQTYINTAQSALASLHLLAEAEKQSMTDPLTGLYNRRSMQTLLQREVALADRHDHPFSIAMVDIDHFKRVNDTHGHAAGDHLLRAFADAVRMTLRRTDLAFRIGGDEFLIALPQTPLAQARQAMQKVRHAFAALDFSHAIAHLGPPPTLSVGIAQRSRHHDLLTLPALLAAADQALYHAKHNQRNCIKTHHPAA